MPSDENPFMEQLLDYLVEVADGELSLTDDMVSVEPDPARRVILAGLLILNDEIRHALDERDSTIQALQRAHETMEEFATERTNAAHAFQRQVVEVEDLNRELRKTQSQLIQSSKLSALGELGAGIAHELNQPLTAIAGIASIALDDRAALPYELVQNLNVVLQETKRMAAIINNVKSFARETVGTSAALCINEVVSLSVGLVGQQLKSLGVQVQQSCSAQNSTVFGDPLALQQVVLNILLNAKDAMQDLPADEARWLGIDVSQNETEVVLRIEDSGPGIPEKVRPRLFEPFYTTKEPGAGTGLGLSISHGIVVKHGGEISCFESRWQGAGFEIRLPMSESAQEPIQPDAMPPKIRTDLGLHILLVDDDTVVLRIMAMLIEKLNCSVETAKSGPDALRRAKQFDFDVIVSDVAMPEMDGPGLIHALRREGLGTPVIFVTGGRTERVIELANNAGAIACLEKPAHREELSAALSKVLNLKQGQ